MGLNEILAIIILAMGFFLLVSEIRNQNKSDLFVSISISVLLFGVSIYNLVQLGFHKETILLTVTYILVVLVAIAFTTIFVIKKIKSNKINSNNEEN